MDDRRRRAARQGLALAAALGGAALVAGWWWRRRRSRNSAGAPAPAAPPPTLLSPASGVVSDAHYYLLGILQRAGEGREALNDALQTARRKITSTFALDERQRAVRDADRQPGKRVRSQASLFCSNSDTLWHVLVKALALFIVSFLDAQPCIKTCIITCSSAGEARAAHRHTCAHPDGDLLSGLDSRNHPPQVVDFAPNGASESSEWASGRSQ